MSKLTLDGVDIMGERLAKEVLEIIQEKPNLCKISFVAHSVGGLVTRYAIGRLYRPPKEEFKEDTSSNRCKEEARGTIGGLEAMNFITVASPHLGSRGNKQVPFLFGVTAFEKAASCVIHWIFRRTGRHLFLTDDDEGKPPLLKRMLDDCDEFYFMSALRIFKRRVLYSNWEESQNETYPHIVTEEHCKACNNDQYETISAEDYGSSDKLEEELIRGLTRVSWEKIDVNFHRSKQRFAAHSVIQVKDQVLHIEDAMFFSPLSSPYLSTVKLSIDISLPVEWIVTHWLLSMTTMISSAIIKKLFSFIDNH
ncbi:Alpha/beta-Hydrolases superfamily protein isoform 2 [Hibiscus syriacus]|uniref:Alpha/beta-Hydrolases superfamily protein isoform 2 n=1 Tax=Hibiscus syriacus TaxID=106335 RepID=A0A6A2WF58_HIBSY|nr:Alpha/beta-Hydrolases superfamily protein isoform 2 [Hibiscus syriacus]